MDTRTLIVTALFAALASTLSLGIVFWTRRVYPGFGHWLAGSGCRLLAAVLFLLPRDSFPPWLTIILANYLLFAEVILYRRGTLIFREQKAGYAWELAASVSFIALFFHFTYLAPSLNARIALGALYSGVWAASFVRLLLTCRPPYFDFVDRWLAFVWGVMATTTLVRAVYVGIFAPTVTDYLSGPAYQTPSILLLILSSLLIAMSQIVMNAQRLEFDLRVTQEKLESDISKRQQIQSLLQSSQDLLLKLSAFVPGVIYQYRLFPDGRSCFPYASEGIHEIYGVMPNAVREDASPVLTRLHPDDLDGVLKSIEASARTMQPWRHEYRVDLPQRGIRWLHGQARPERLQDGSVLWHGCITDITDLKQKEYALRENEEKFRLAFDNVNAGMFLVATDGRILQTNSKASAIFGYSRSELESMTVNDIALPEDSALSPNYMRQALEGTVEQVVFEKHYRHKNGQIIHGQVSSSLVHDAQGKALYFISQVIDITEAKRYERELHKAREIAEEANRAKSDFLATISHEIRTPLNAVIGLTHLTLETELTSQQRYSLTTVETSARALLHLINDILDVSKIEAGQLEVIKEPFELRGLIEEVESLFAILVADKGVKLETALADDIPPYLIGDALRLRQVLVNLVGNAIKFTERGEVRIQASLLRAAESNVILCLAVSDTGIGMRPEQLERLFTRFVQADSSITRRYGGTGLGLSISKHLVEIMGGEIKVASREGEGTTFSFNIELERVGGEGKQGDLADQASSAMTQETEQTQPTVGRELQAVELLQLDILLSELDQLLATKMLDARRLGFEVEALLSGTVLEDRFREVLDATRKLKFPAARSALLPLIETLKNKTEKVDL